MRDSTGGTFDWSTGVYTGIKADSEALPDPRGADQIGRTYFYQVRISATGEEPWVIAGGQAVLFNDENVYPSGSAVATSPYMPLNLGDHTTINLGDHTLTVAGTDSATAGENNGLAVTQTISPAANSAGSHRGVNGKVVSAGNSDIPFLIGIRGEAQHAGDGVAAAVYGGQSAAVVAVGKTATKSVGHRVETVNSGTVTNAYGIEITHDGDNATGESFAIKATGGAASLESIETERIEFVADNTRRRFQNFALDTPTDSILVLTTDWQNTDAGKRAVLDLKTTAGGANIADFNALTLRFGVDSGGQVLTALIRGGSALGLPSYVGFDAGGLLAVAINLGTANLRLAVDLLIHGSFDKSAWSISYVSALPAWAVTAITGLNRVDDLTVDGTLSNPSDATWKRDLQPLDLTSFSAFDSLVPQSGFWNARSPYADGTPFCGYTAQSVMGAFGEQFAIENKLVAPNTVEYLDDDGNLVEADTPNAQVEIRYNIAGLNLVAAHTWYLQSRLNAQRAAAQAFKDADKSTVAKTRDAINAFCDALLT